MICVLPNACANNLQFLRKFELIWFFRRSASGGLLYCLLKWELGNFSHLLQLRSAPPCQKKRRPRFSGTEFHRKKVHMSESLPKNRRTPFRGTYFPRKKVCMNALRRKTDALVRNTHAVHFGGPIFTQKSWYQRASARPARNTRALHFGWHIFTKKSWYQRAPYVNYFRWSAKTFSSLHQQDNSEMKIRKFLKGINSTWKFVLRNGNRVFFARAPFISTFLGENTSYVMDSVYFSGGAVISTFLCENTFYEMDGVYFSGGRAYLNFFKWKYVLQTGGFHFFGRGAPT